MDGLFAPLVTSTLYSTLLSSPLSLLRHRTANRLGYHSYSSRLDSVTDRIHSAPSRSGYGPGMAQDEEEEEEEDEDEEEHCLSCLIM
jgi:hypothetical protein